MKYTCPKALLLILLMLVAPIVSAQVVDSDALLVDIPEPPGARSELPSPVPMVYNFVGAIMDGDFDVCLSNFDVKTFLDILFNRQIERMDAVDYRELFSYQVQTHRNEFRFLAKVMNRVAKGAEISYSDPRYHKKVQIKIVVRLDTNKGRFEFIVYCRYVDERWRVYDYVLNGQRISKIFQAGLQGVGVDRYVASLRPFYGETKGLRPIRSKEFDFAVSVPSSYQIREKVSPALLAAVGAFNGQFLLHIQAATYDEPQNLSQVGKAIKETLMPFSPRLYDQWKSEIAGVEIGNVLFHFLKNGKRLFTHMVIIPLGRKLIVMNFYHSSLQLLKHMTNMREKIMESIALPKIEAVGGVLPGEIPDELTLSDGANELDLEGQDFENSGDLSISPNAPYASSSGYSSEIPPPTSDEADNMLTPDSYSNDNDSGYPDPPPPPVDDDGLIMNDPGDDEIPPPPGSYGDGSGSTNDDDNYDPGGGSDVSF